MVEWIHSTAEVKIALLPYYLLVGGLFAVVFFIFARQKFDSGLKGSSWGFYLLITPSIVILWPILFFIWLRAKKPQHD